TILGKTAPNCRRERKQNLSLSEPFPRGPMMLLFDPRYNLNVRGQGLWRDYFYHMAILIDQVFLKVPFHLGILVSIFILLGKEAVQRVHILPFDRYFGHHGKAHPKIGLTERFDFIIGSRFLARKIVCRKPEDHKIVRTVPFIKFLQLFILWGKPTFTCSVHYHHLFAL